MLVMLSRNMEFAPAPEDLPKVAEILALDLMAIRITNVDRILEALETAGRTYTKWPSTALIIGLLRDKRTNSQMYQEKPKALPEPEEVTNARYEQGARKIKELMKSLGASMNARPEKTDEQKRREEIRNECLTENARKVQRVLDSMPNKAIDPKAYAAWEIELESIQHLLP